MRRVDKRYRAYVYGHLGDSGKIAAEILRSSQRPKYWYARASAESDARVALTEWRTRARGEDAGEAYSYVEAHPITGRTHQIRVHFSFIGHPIVGDFLYAPKRQQLLGFKRPALHAQSISYIQPNGARVEFSALNPDFP